MNNFESRLAHAVSPDERWNLVDLTACHRFVLAVVGLQNNFINRDALLPAFTAWVVDERRPLEEILCEPSMAN